MCLGVYKPLPKHPAAAHGAKKGLKSDSATPAAGPGLWKAPASKGQHFCVPHAGAPGPPSAHNYTPKKGPETRSKASGDVRVGLPPLRPPAGLLGPLWAVLDVKFCQVRFGGCM